MIAQSLPSMAGHAPGMPEAIAVSQVSLGCTVPSPQVAEQSPSLRPVQPAGQQPSLAVLHTVTSVCTQCAPQPVPAMLGVWQELPSLQPPLAIGSLATFGQPPLMPVAIRS